MGQTTTASEASPRGEQWGTAKTSTSSTESPAERGGTRAGDPAPEMCQEPSDMPGVLQMPWEPPDAPAAPQTYREPPRYPRSPQTCREPPRCPGAPQMPQEAPTNPRAHLDKLPAPQMCREPPRPPRRPQTSLEPTLMNRCSSTSCSHLRLFSSFSVTFRRAFVHWRKGQKAPPVQAPTRCSSGGMTR